MFSKEEFIGRLFLCKEYHWCCCNSQINCDWISPNLASCVHNNLARVPEFLSYSWPWWNVNTVWE